MAIRGFSRLPLTSRFDLKQRNVALRLLTNNASKMTHNFCKMASLTSGPLARVRMPMTEISRTKLGVEVKGLLLTEVHKFPDFVKEEIRQIVSQERLVIFRDQGKVGGHQHVEISKWFGPLDSRVPKGDPLYTHPKCPHPGIHRISNDASEACTDVGRSGWHMDGSLLKKPFGYALYHMTEVPKSGATEFIGFKELLDSIPEDMRRRWERLWSVPDKGDKPVHPLVYSHPVTKLPVMCVHLGMIDVFIFDKGTEKERETDKEETGEIIKEITNEIEKGDKRLVYSHEWKDGDFIISDNLAVAHFASAASQRPRSEIGLRVLHRTTVAGTSSPSK